MAPRNRLMGHGAPLGRRQEIQEEPKWRGCIYHAVTGEVKDFDDEDERNAALETKEYVASPALVGPHNADDYQKMATEEMVIAGIPYEDEEFEKEVKETINYAETLQLRDLTPKKKKKYLTTMNVQELCREGLKWGLDFESVRPFPTKLEMVYQIKFEKKMIGKDKAGKEKAVEIKTWKRLIH